MSQRFAAENSSVRRHALLLGLAAAPATVIKAEMPSLTPN